MQGCRDVWLISGNIRQTLGCTGSPLYVAPEVLQPMRYNHSADLWGAGMLAFMILTAQLPFTTAAASVSVADLYSGAAR